MNVFSLSNLRLSTVSLLIKLVKFVVLNCTIYVLLLARKLEFRKKELISKIYHSYIKKEYSLPENTLFLIYIPFTTIFYIIMNKQT